MRQPRHPGTEEIELANVLSALGDPVRLHIVEVLADGAEHTRDDFEVALAQSTLSHHMKTLREAGVTRHRNEGTRCYVRLRADVDERYPGVLGSVLAAVRRS